MRRLRIGAARGLVGMLAAVSVGVLALGGGAAATPTPARGSDGVTAIMLDPYSGCGEGTGDAWWILNSDWSDYGSVPVTISTGGDLCAGRFTLADLEASGADTVILDGIAWNHTLTRGEISALQTYLEQGHTLLGSETIFQWKTKHSDNGLAPLFGLAEQPTWHKDGLQGQSPTYRLKERDPDAGVLLRDVDNPYVSSPYGDGQKPAHKKWFPNVLEGARYIGKTADKRNAITVYDEGSYTAIYISSEAAFYGTPDDFQFLYNAIIYPNEG